MRSVVWRKKRNKPGTTQVGAISKAQKDSKTTFSTTGNNKSSQKTKNWEKKIPIFFYFFFEVSGKSHSAEKCKRGDAFLPHVGRFGCVENEILSIYGKIGKCALIALMHKKWTLRVELTKKKLATVRVGIFFENAD